MPTALEKRNAALRALAAQVAPVRNGSVTQFAPVRQLAAAQKQQQQAAAEASADPNERILAAVAARSGNKGKPSKGGGVLGFLANNPLTQGASGVLSAIDVPRRAVISGLQEGIDAIGSGDASWGDFKDQVGDEQFGFGSVIGDLTGNKWADRALGFAGDVLLDPTTYLGLGAGRFMGQSGRVAAASQLRAAGAADDVVRLAGRSGVSALDNEARALLGLNDAGVTFMGKRIGRDGVVGKGNDALARATGGALTKARLGVADSGIGGAVRARRGNEGLRPAINALHDGGNAELSVGSAVDRLRMSTVAREVEGRGQGTFRRRITDAIKGKDVHARQQMTREAEQGGNSLFTDIANWGATEGLVVPRRANYAPHIPASKEAREFFAGDTTANRFVDAAGASGRLKHRELDVGTHTLYGRQFHLETGTIDELNSVLAHTFPENKIGKFFEDDFGKLAAIYSAQIARDAGSAKAARMIDEGANGLVDVLDTQAMRSGVNGLKAADKGALTGGQADVADTLRTMLSGVDAARTGGLQALQPRLDDATRGVADVELQRAGLQGDMLQARGGVAAAERAIGTNSRLTSEVDALTDELDQLAQVLPQHDARIEQLTAAIATVPPGQREPIREALSAAKKERATVAARQKAVTKRVENRNAVIRDHDELLADYDIANSAVHGVELAQADLADQMATLQSQRAKLVKLHGKLSKRSPQSADEASRYMVEVDALIQQADDPELAKVRGLLLAATDQLTRVHKAEDSKNVLAQIVRDGRGFEDVDDIIITELHLGFTRIAEDLTGGEGVIVRKDLAKAIEHTEDAIRGGGMWDMWDNYTQFFKTYATLTPGFHVRNLMGATFMNFSDGVGVASMTRSLRLWKGYSKDPESFLAAADEPTRRAFSMVFGSGAGGSVSAEEIGRNTRILNNPLTKAGRKAGEWVEGPVRLAMALDSVAKGAQLDEGVARISRIHFDYSQLSNFDRNAKRLLPFWTFMSRNLPLQLTQILAKPRTYNRYSSLVRNVRDNEEGELVPLWWTERGAFGIGGGNYLMPDLQHVNLQEDLHKLDPRNLLRTLSDVNPALRVPLELAANKSFFTGGQISYDEEGDRGMDNLLYALTGLVPPAAQVQRLAGLGERYADRQQQSWTNVMGIPLRQLTPSLQESERKRREKENA